MFNNKKPSEMVGYKKEYNLWLFSFIIVNVIATVVMYESGLLLGDLESVDVYNNATLLAALAMVIFSYYFILRWIFNILTRIRIPRIFDIRKLNGTGEKILGYTLFALQILYIIFNLKEGTNTAGAVNVKTDSIWAYFWVLVPVDGLFYLYYGFHREDKLFKYNLLIFVLSNLMRGWSGVFLFIVFFEWCRAFRRNKLNYLKITILAVIGGMLYPFLLNLKWVIRAASASQQNLLSVSSVFLDLVGNVSYVEMFYKGIAQLSGRLQQTAILVEIIHYKALLQDEFTKGMILPFWSDGLPQIIFRRALGTTAPPSIGVGITTYLFPDSLFDLGSYNISIGYMGWFFIAPNFALLYIMYTFFLCIISVVLLKQLDRKEGGLDALWLAWLVYLLAGWLIQFIAFIYAIFAFIILTLLTQYFSRLRLKWN
ncbi:oligosaccharide repeat unit polymerase [Pedobacter sp. JCM 36344]|uniref:oligosaccharide repeat unit polymerase n=1 Tax=Pedobacter sp. JCM 36344 TaxID=3374280 RepID=UPI00397A080D